jgi:hypothetical protein
MAELSELSPDQLLALLRMQMLAGGTPSAGGGEFGGQNAGGQINTFDNDGRQVALGGGNVAVPTEYGTLRLSGGGMYRDDAQGSRGYEFAPMLAYDAGPVGVRYGQRFGDSGSGETFGGTARLGPVEFTADRSIPDQGRPTDNYGVSFPLAGARLRGAVTRGKDMPTQYQTGISVPGLLGGELEVAGQYTPETRDKAIYGRFRRRF